MGRTYLYAVISGIRSTVHCPALLVINVDLHHRDKKGVAERKEYHIRISLVTSFVW